VVNRLPQALHSRLRLIACPSAASRDSITRISSLWHLLHFTFQASPCHHQIYRFKDLKSAGFCFFGEIFVFNVRQRYLA
jgi:hypothetical protein